MFYSWYFFYFFLPFPYSFPLSWGQTPVSTLGHERWRNMCNSVKYSEYLWHDDNNYYFHENARALNLHIIISLLVPYTSSNCRAFDQLVSGNENYLLHNRHKIQTFCVSAFVSFPTFYFMYLIGVFCWGRGYWVKNVHSKSPLNLFDSLKQKTLLSLGKSQGLQQLS